MLGKKELTQWKVKNTRFPQISLKMKIAAILGGFARYDSKYLLKVKS